LPWPAGSTEKPSGQEHSEGSAGASPQCRIEMGWSGSQHTGAAPAQQAGCAALSHHAPLGAQRPAASQSTGGGGGSTGGTQGTTSYREQDGASPQVLRAKPSGHDQPLLAPRSKRPPPASSPVEKTMLPA